MPRGETRGQAGGLVRQPLRPPCASQHCGRPADAAASIPPHNRSARSTGTFETAALVLETGRYESAHNIGLSTVADALSTIGRSVVLGVANPMLLLYFEPACANHLTENPVSPPFPST